MATADIGIQSYGAYIPRRRLSRAAIAEAHAWAFPSLKAMGKGEKSFCSWDEDVITQAVEAGRDCLLGVDASTVGSVQLASTTAPYADLQNASLISAALSLGSSVHCADSAGSTRAGLSALIQACNSASEQARLVIASERRLAKPGSAQEMTYGSGAAAALIGSGDGLIARFLGARAHSVPFVDHFRQSGERYDYGWEERWVRDEGISKIVPATVRALLSEIGRGAEAVTHFGMSGGPVGADKLVAKTLGFTGDGVLPDFQGQVGDTGAAQSLLQLSAALERASPGDLIVLVAFGQGCEVIAFEMLAKPESSSRRGLAGSLAARIPETAYLKMLSFNDGFELDWGMRAETDSKTALTELYRSADQVLSFTGGRCEACGTVQFPRLPSCVKCKATHSQKPYSLMNEPAKVATYTADWLMYTPSPPLYVGLVQFDVGARLLMEMVDVGSQGIDVGTPLRMTYRIKERDRLRHFDRYFWKATPAL